MVEWLCCYDPLRVSLRSRDWNYFFPGDVGRGSPSRLPLSTTTPAMHSTKVLHPGSIVDSLIGSSRRQVLLLILKCQAVCTLFPSLTLLSEKFTTHTDCLDRWQHSSHRRHDFRQKVCYWRRGSAARVVHGRGGGAVNVVSDASKSPQDSGWVKIYELRACTTATYCRQT